MDFGYTYHKLKCSQCSRKILVEIFVNGSSHNVGVSALCAECIPILTEDYKKEHPKAAEDILQWKEEKE